MPATPRERAVSALASGAILIGMVAMLVIGLRPPAFREKVTSLIAVAFAPDQPRRPPPPPPPPPRADKAAAPRERAAPAALRNAATQIVAPPPALPLAVAPIIVAPKAGTGSAAANGAADVPGTGSGAGGLGNGTGGGGTGGSGTGQGAAIRAQQTRGRLSPRDVPDGLIPPGGSASVSVHFTITPAGRAVDCRVTRSSGDPDVDAVPCRLIEDRYRFRPARDRSGQLVEDQIDETHTWFEPIK